MTIFLIGLPWLALVVAALIDHKQESDGAALPVLIGAAISGLLVLLGYGMGVMQ